MEFSLEKLSTLNEVYTNKIFLNPKLKDYGNKAIINDKIVFDIGYSNKIIESGVGLSKMQREFLSVSQTLDKVKLEKFNEISHPVTIGFIKLKVEPVDKTIVKEINEEKFTKDFLKLYNNQYLSKNLKLYTEIQSVKVIIHINSIGYMNEEIINSKYNFGKLSESTDIEYLANPESSFKIKNSVTTAINIFKPDFSFKDLGIGGLDEHIAFIFRKAFSSRRLPNEILKYYGMKHIKGLILYGPPGTGKTLIARELGKCLKSKEPKIVKGPELFNKYVGESEKNLRELFEPAIQDYKKYKDNSQLHIIIFDEFDAIAKARGSSNSGTGVNDNLVNQLLSMIDGVEQINNILVIGMTNRIDLLDKAILRSGRFDAHIEIGLPNEQGRLQILNIHTKVMQENNLLETDVDLKYLSSIMKNYTGAEIENVIKSANSFALNKKLDLMNFDKKIEIKELVKVGMIDFLDAIKEIRPEFGMEEGKLELKGNNYIYKWNNTEELLTKMRNLGNDILKDKLKETRLILHGPSGTGKTTLACYYALQSEFPFVKFISSEDLVGQNEYYKINQLVKFFDDAKKSTYSLLIIDDIERLIEFVPIGYRFNNNILQTLINLIKQPFKSNIFIIATTSNPMLMKKLGLFKIFNLKLDFPNLKNSNKNQLEKLTKEIIGDDNIKLDLNNQFELSIKSLLFICKMMTKMEGKWTDRFLQAFNDVKDDDENDDDF